MRRAATARELDHEAYERRERLSSTLDELSSSLTPGRILDEVLSYAKGGGANFLMGLGKSAASNPLPTLLISTGCALFLSGRGRLSGGPVKENAVNSASTEFDRSVRGRDFLEPGMVSKMSNAMAGAVSAVGDAVGTGANKLSSATSSLGEQVADTAKEAADTVAGVASRAGENLTSAGERAQAYAEDVADSVRQSASGVQKHATLLGRELNGKAADAFNEYPLVIAAGGLLVGAALAALLPRTSLENRYMGNTSDALKDAFAEGASDSIDRVSASVEHVVDAVADAAQKENVAGAARDGLENIAVKLGETLKAGKDALNDEIGASADQFPGADSKKLHRDIERI